MIVEKKPIYAKSCLKQWKKHFLCISRHIKTSICPSVAAELIFDTASLRRGCIENGKGDRILYRHGDKNVGSNNNSRLFVLMDQDISAALPLGPEHRGQYVSIIPLRARQLEGPQWPLQKRCWWVGRSAGVTYPAGGHSVTGRRHWRCQWRGKCYYVLNENFNLI